MINIDNLEVEFRAISSSFSAAWMIYEFEIQYRVKPAQLNWFRRCFMNRWKYLQKCVWDECYPYTTKNPESTLRKLKKQLKTLNDTQEFEREEYKKAMRERMSLENARTEGTKIFYMDYDSERSEGKV